MAIVLEYDEEGFNEWAKTRPLIIQELIKKFPPDRLYKMKSTGKRVTIEAYDEDETLIVNVSERFNTNIFFERSVFDVPVENLEECDLPSDGEEVGSMI